MEYQPIQVLFHCRIDPEEERALAQSAGHLHLVAVDDISSLMVLFHLLLSLHNLRIAMESRIPRLLAIQFFSLK